ncbi:MAG: hypothetical protein ACLRWP_09435 [Bilophila wadsworthia]
MSKLQLPGDITQAQADTVIRALSPKQRAGRAHEHCRRGRRGNLKAFTRMDGAFSAASTFPSAARTARLFNMPTSALGAASARQGIVRH